MGSTTRSLIVATRVDNSGMKEGLQESVALEKSYVEKTNQLNKEIVEARNAYKSAQKSGAFVKEAKEQLDAAREAQRVNKSTQQEQRQLENQQFQEFLATERAKKQVDDEYFRATHTQLENRLRDNQTYYAKLRQMHAENAEMLMAIDRTEAVKEAQIRGEGASRGILGIGKGRKAIGLIGSEVAGSISPELGKGVGTGMMVGLMTESVKLGVAVGAVVAVAASIAKGFDVARESAKKLVDLQHEFTDAAKEAAKALRDESPTTAVGDRMRNAIEIWDKKKTEFDRSAKDADESFKSFHGIHPIDAMVHMLGGKTDIDVRAKADEESQKSAVMMGAYRMQAISQVAEEGRRIEDNNGLALRRLQVEGMRAGAAKEYAALQGKQEQERADARHKQEDNPHGGDLMSPLLARQAQESANLKSKQAEDVYQEEVSANQAELRLISDTYDREVALLNDKHAEEIISYDKAGRDKTQLLLRQASEEKEIALHQAEWLKSQRESLDPRLRGAAYHQQMQDAARATGGTPDEANALEKRHNDQAIDDTKKRLDIELALATSQITLIQAEERRLAITDSLSDATKRTAFAQEQQEIRNANENKTLDQETRHNELERKRAMGESMYAGHPAELAKFREQMEREEFQQQLENAGIKADPKKIDAMIKSKHAVETAQEDANIDKQIQRDQIEIKLERGKISRLEAEKQRLRLSNPEASQEKINELAKEKLSMEDSRKARKDSGESSTKYSGGQVNFRQLNFDSQFKTADPQVDLLGKIHGVLQMIERKHGIT